jgi:hypothetical protein
MPALDNEEYSFPDEEKKGVEDDSDFKFEIEIEDDTPEEDRNKTPMPEPLAKELEKDDLEEYDEKVKTKLKQMRKVWHDERREKEAALREHQEAVTLVQQLFQENQRIKAARADELKQHAETAADAAKLGLDAAKKAFKEAYEAGDPDLLVEAQQALSEAQMRVFNAKAAKSVPTVQEENIPVQQQPQTNQPSPADRKALAWQQRNPWFGQDEEMTASVLGLHKKLEREGVEIGSDSYYATLDKTMRKRFPEQFEGEEEPKPKAKGTTVVAPATRSTSPTKIKMSASAVQLAKRLGLTPEQYAREVMKLESQNG